MIRFVYVVMIFIPLASWSQSNVFLEGVVINSYGEPIPFAHLQIKNKAIGVSANEHGQYRFIIPTFYQQDTLLISSIGYLSLAQIISSFDPGIFQTFKLEETSIVLKEIVVKDIHPSEILKRAINLMEQHFDEDPYSMESFFRIAVKKDSAYIGLLDAAIDIHDSGLRKRHGFSADLLQLRKIVYTNNWLPGGSLSFRSPAISIEEEFGKRLKDGILNYDRAMKYWHLETAHPIQKDNETFYVLNASPKRQTANNPYYFATLIIRADDYAIMSITYDYRDNLIKFSEQFPAAHPYGGYMSDKTLLHFNSIKGEFTFTDYNGKLYLSRASYKETGSLSNEHLDTHFAYEGSFEIFVNRIFHGRKGQASKPISRHDDIFKLTDLYDSTFWKNYNKPISTQLYEKAISNMTYNGDIKKQFLYFTSLEEGKMAESLLTQEKQTEHFIFNYTLADTAVIETIMDTLESNYQRITHDLQSFNQPRVTVKIYPDLKAYRLSIGNTKVISWMIGSSFGPDEFRIVSPLHPGPNHSYQSVLQSLLHEFTHCLHANVTSEKIPVRWLWEAIACYESGQFVNPSKLNYIKNRNFPTLNQMNMDTEKGYVYELGYVLTKYIKENWGTEKLMELLQSNADVDKVLGISESKFEENFYTYVSNNF